MPRNFAGADGPHQVKIVVAHNAYQHRGGEDAVMASEVAVLRQHGHDVIEYCRHNDELAHIGALQAARETLWSTRTTREIEALFQQERPDMLHVHNTFPLISPSLYWAASKACVPVVQTLHNFRLLCPQGMFLREERVCEDCLGRAPLPGVVHACYRNSVAQSGVLASMLMLHRGLRTWSSKVDRYIALNQFCRDKFIAGGLPADRIAVKPNFVDQGEPAPAFRSGLLFVGRLSPEKGIAALGQAAAAVPHCTVRVAGSGPAASLLADVPGVQMLGSVNDAQVMDEMARAIALLIPSVWYENFPRTLVEAYACGLPVLASRIGALATIVEDGVTGLLFEPGSADDLASKMRWAMAHPKEMAVMGRAARRLYEQQYTPLVNYRQLMTIYADAKASQRRRTPTAASM